MCFCQLTIKSGGPPNVKDRKSFSSFRCINTVVPSFYITFYYIHTEIYSLKRREINFRSQAGLRR